MAYCRSLVLVAGLAYCFPNTLSAYENPRYITSKMYADNTCDTVGILTCRTDPQYMQPTVLDFEYIVQREQTESLRVYLSTGQICNFIWDKYSHTWCGDFDQGDTLKCSFTFTPLTVGTMGLNFKVDSGPSFGEVFPFGFTLDERGQVIPGVLRGGGYGMLGPLPEIAGDSLFFVGPCCYGEHCATRQSFSIIAKLVPEPPPI